MAWYAKRGDYGFFIETTLADADGPVNLTGADIAVGAKRDKGVETFSGVGEAVDVTDPEASPNARYRVAPDDLAVPGVYRLEWQVTWAAGTPEERRETFPADDPGYDELIVKDDIVA